MRIEIESVKRSSLTPLVLGLAWMVSLGCVYSLGLISAFAFHLKPGVEASAGLTPSEREAGAVFEQLTGEPLEWGVLRSFNPGDRVPPQVMQLVDLLAALPEGPEPVVLSARFFRVLPPAKLEGVLEESLSIPPLDGPRALVLKGMIDAWRVRDAVGSAQFLEALERSEDPPLKAWAEAASAH